MRNVLVECGSSQCPPNASGRYVLLAQAAYLLAHPTMHQSQNLLFCCCFFLHFHDKPGGDIILDDLVTARGGDNKT